MRHKDNYDLMAKLIIIGDSGVGKTNIILNFVQEQFKDNYVATIGVDFKTKTIQVDNRTIKLQIWDTAGQERYRTITETYYKGASAIMFAYAINDKCSFANIQRWISQINLKVPSSIPKLIVANKSDLPLQERTISREQSVRLAEKYGLHINGDGFIEVSAKNCENIEEAFRIISKKINSVAQKSTPVKIISRGKQQPKVNCLCVK